MESRSSLRAAQKDVKPGAPTEQTGRAAVSYIKKAVDLIKAGQCDYMATAPINKAAVRAAGIEFTGHTELLAELSGTTETRMLLTAGDFRAVHVTTHVALRKAYDLITKDHILRTIELAYTWLKRLVKSPNIAVAGLNPHAGEGAAFVLRKSRKSSLLSKQRSKRGFPLPGLSRLTRFFTKCSSRGMTWLLPCIMTRAIFPSSFWTLVVE